ncbi:MAG: NADH-quinone oxidoreductase subunit J [Thermofilum sp.]|jgi:NADH-quinone oxidoreductase subunit J|uniref:NADH-quinone oxidoreductase subunit J family protein n=1 Tax=Thermofilum sp. TaxID=1961369 RepID=UPI00258F8F68|nr:NADH-quinone oxidoreductase subunit J [Thermofilum sp.]MCI4409844.1 NADH-quinone oxidoreductase subunit J [Thermofilum sp.]
MSLPEFSLVYVLAAGTVAVIAAILSVKAREDFYSAILLGIVGLAIASLIALLGFPYVGIFQALVYVGATVMFVIMGVVFIGRGMVSEKKMILPAVLVAVLVFFSVLQILVSPLAQQVTTVNTALSLEGLLKVFSENLLAFFYLSLSLLALLLAGISIARGETNE